MSLSFFSHLIFYLSSVFSILCCRWSVICWYSSLDRVLNWHSVMLWHLSWDLLIGKATSQRRCFLLSWRLQKQGSVLLVSSLCCSQVKFVHIFIFFSNCFGTALNKKQAKLSNCFLLWFIAREMCCKPHAAGCDLTCKHVHTDPQWIPLKHDYFWLRTNLLCK